MSVQRNQEHATTSGEGQVPPSVSPTRPRPLRSPTIPPAPPASPPAAPGVPPAPISIPPSAAAPLPLSSAPPQAPPPVGTATGASQVAASPVSKKPVAAARVAAKSVAQAVAPNLPSDQPAVQAAPTNTTKHAGSDHAAARRKTPSWLASLVFHLVLLLVLALIPIHQIVSGPITFLLGESAGDISSEFDLSAADDQHSEMLESSDLSPMETIDATNPLKELTLPEPIAPVLAPEQVDVADSNPLESLPYGITVGLSGRTGSMKDSLLKQFGGTGETEAAVELGLAWLARQQNSDGSWSLLGPYSQGGALENQTAATALALNAFLGAGYTHKKGKYSKNVQSGLRWLVRRQDSQGFFADGEPAQQYMYAQAIASICVIEAFGMTKDTELIGPAQAAIKFAEASQSKLRGWRYEPREDADLSVTGWYMMVLATGQMAGLEVDRHLFKTVGTFLDSVSSEDYSRYAYTTARGPSLTMTAEGMLCRIYLGWPRDHPSLKAAIRDDFLANLPANDGQDNSVYYTYYATQVLHHVGGEDWRRWNAAMRTVLPESQNKLGPQRGSWDPGRDLFGAAGGRLYVTCLNIYCLEVYYRHLAIYKP